MIGNMGKMKILPKTWLAAAMLLGCSPAASDAIFDGRVDVIQPRILNSSEFKEILEFCPEAKYLNGDIFSIHLSSHDLIGSSENCQVGSNGRICELMAVRSVGNECRGKYFLSPSIIRADQDTVDFGQDTWRHQPGYKSIEDSLISLAGSGSVYLGLSNSGAGLLIDQDQGLFVWYYSEE